MGRRVAQRRRPVRAWIDKHWELMLVILPIAAAVAVVAFTTNP